MPETAEMNKLLLVRMLWVTLTIMMNCNLIVFAQTPTQSLEFTYDAAGNRIVGQVIEIQNKNNQNAAKDVQKEDSAAMAGQVQDTGSSQNHGEANGFADIVGDQKITIYPNPTSGSLKIQITPFHPGSGYELLLFDLQAHILLKQTL